MNNPLVYITDNWFLAIKLVDYVTSDIQQVKTWMSEGKTFAYLGGYEFFKEVDLEPTNHLWVSLFNDTKNGAYYLGYNSHPATTKVVNARLVENPYFGEPSISQFNAGRDSAERLELLRKRHEARVKRLAELR